MKPAPTPFDWAVGESIQDITAPLARRLVKLVRAVARSGADANVIEEARRLTWEMRERAVKRGTPVREARADGRARGTDGRFASQHDAELRALAQGRKAA